MNTRTENGKKTFEITDGPSRDALFDACKYAFSENAKVNIEPKVVVESMRPLGPGCGCMRVMMQIKNVVVAGIWHLEESDEKFIFCGRCLADLKAVSSKNAVYQRYDYVANYNVKTRKGTISFSV